MAPHLRDQMSMLLGDRQMPVFPAPVANRRQPAGVTLLCRYLPHDVLALSRLSPNVAEAEEGERRPIRFRVVFSIRSVAAEIDEARLVGVERELVSTKTLAQNIQNPLGILEVRERHHGIVGESDKGTFPLEAWLHLVLEPRIQHMMQEDIREAGRDHTPLRGAFGRMAQETIFQDPCLQPFIDHPSDHTIRDSSVKKGTQVGVRDRIEVFFDVEIDHPTHRVMNLPGTQGLRGLMAVRPGRKPYEQEESPARRRPPVP